MLLTLTALTVAWLVQFPWVATGLLVAVLAGTPAAMERPDTRRFWAWVGTGAGALAMAALIVLP